MWDKWIGVGMRAASNSQSLPAELERGGMRVGQEGGRMVGLASGMYLSSRTQEGTDCQRGRVSNRTFVCIAYAALASACQRSAGR